MKAIFILALIVIAVLIVLGIVFDGTALLSGNMETILESACNMAQDCTW